MIESIIAYVSANTIRVEWETKRCYYTNEQYFHWFLYEMITFSRSPSPPLEWMFGFVVNAVNNEQMFNVNWI